MCGIGEPVRGSAFEPICRKWMCFVINSILRVTAFQKPPARRRRGPFGGAEVVDAVQRRPRGGCAGIDTLTLRQRNAFKYPVLRCRDLVFSIQLVRQPAREIPDV